MSLPVPPRCDSVTTSLARSATAMDAAHVVGMEGLGKQHIAMLRTWQMQEVFLPFGGEA